MCVLVCVPGVRATQFLTELHSFSRSGFQPASTEQSILCVGSEGIHTHTHSHTHTHTHTHLVAYSYGAWRLSTSVLVQRAYTHSLSTPRQRSGCARPPHAPAAALFSGHRPTPATLKLNKSNSSDRKVWATFIFPPRFWTPGARGPAQAKEICAIRNKRPTIF